uniref:Uncharacterized protein n=1 Tax=Rhizophagus irregularis (strain DAOM 181602 / DAOM 197198 / MUCL 43194) TaxID=747089 RepID=U9UF10_RHIID
MFLDHIITKDNAFLEDYNTIKKNLQHKGGKIPRWYTFLKNNITINNQGRLLFDLDKPIIQNPMAPRPPTPPVDGNTLHHPKRSQQWVTSWIPHLSDIVYGKLLMKLLKVKAHSGHQFNDIADIQAKLGRTQPIPTTIIHDHLPNQTITLNWNNKIPLDKDVRKCVGTILNYRRLDNHLNHASLESIKNDTKNLLINWALSSKWFNYNGRNDTTSPLHTKDLKWKIRCSTLTLPTLDILNRNFPLLIKDRTQCLSCQNHVETNIHLWECSDNYELIKSSFIQMGDILINLLKSHADRLSLVISDSIKYSPTFRWAYRSEPIHPTAFLLLKSYISNDLLGIFRAHINTMKHIVKLIMPYMHQCSILIKIHIWKARNQKWKALRDVWGITKKSFTKYRDIFSRNQRIAAAFNRPVVIDNNRDMERGYINPFNDFRNFKLDKDFYLFYFRHRIFYIVVLSFHI